MCTGSLGANPANDLVEIIHEVGDRINFYSSVMLKIFR